MHPTWDLTCYSDPDHLLCELPVSSTSRVHRSYFRPYPPDEFAARFHHKLVFIHPFANGNGRHARLMADLILEKIFAFKVFSWGGGSLTNHNQIREKYIKVLKLADEHDYSLLLEFVRS